MCSLISTEHVIKKEPKEIYSIVQKGHKKTWIGYLRNFKGSRHIDRILKSCSKSTTLWKVNFHFRQDFYTNPLSQSPWNLSKTFLVSGQKSRTRECHSQINGGKSCQEILFELDSEAELILDQDANQVQIQSCSGSAEYQKYCPVEPQWRLWSEW